MNGVGRVKLAWLEGTTAHSQMFDNVHEKNDYLRHHKPKHYTVMHLIDCENGHYRWKLQPEAAGKIILFMHSHYWFIALIIAYLLFYRIRK